MGSIAEVVAAAAGQSCRTWDLLDCALLLLAVAMSFHGDCRELVVEHGQQSRESPYSP